MPPSSSVPPARATASPRGGCPSRLWLPPLSTLLVSILLTCLLLQLGEQAALSQPAVWPTLAAVQTDYSNERTGSGTSELAPLFTPEVQFWENHIRAWADQMNLDPNLIATIMQIESCGDPRALSPAGAQGLFQVMPYHFAPGEDAYDPDTNARRGLMYLQHALQKSNGNLDLALAAYNGGIGVIGLEELFWPVETRRYLYWAGGIYADARLGHSESARLQEWLLAGGVSLCRQAHRRLGLGE